MINPDDKNSNESSRPQPASAPQPVSMPLPPRQEFTGELRPDLEIFRGGADEKGKATWVIFDPVSGNYFRFSEKDYRIIGCLSGNQEMGAFLTKLKESGITADRQEAVKLISFLQQSNLFKPVYGLTEAKAVKARDFKKSMFWHIVLSTYLFFRIPLISPDRFLQRTLERVMAIFNPWTLFTLKMVAAIGYLCLIVNFYKFADAFIASISIQGLLRYSLAIVLIKVIHEFAHAYTARNYGCRVRKMGVAFIVFFPRFYTDITDSWRIPDRWKRFQIDGAGVFSELLIGGFAALVWANTSSGPANTVAYYIFAVSILNTVFVNGNPFIRYDGYYMLMDIVNIDNLQKRGTELVRGIWRRYLFGMEVPPDPSTGWKRQVLIFYSISAFLYRIFLYTSIILIVYFQFIKVVGIVLLILEVYLLILKPVIDEGRFLVANWGKFKHGRATRSLGGALSVLIILSIPLPWSIVAPCEVKSKESVMLYAPVNGFLEELNVADGQAVKRGELLMAQRDPFLDWRRQEARFDYEIDLLQLDQAQGDKEQLRQIGVRRETLEHSRDTVSEIERKRVQLRTNSQIDGIFALYERHLKVGKWLAKGELVGEVFAPDARNAIAYVQEDDAKYIRAGDRVSVSLSDGISSYSGRVAGIIPLPAELPPSPLLKNYGGPIIVYNGGNGLFTPVSTYYQIDIEFSKSSPNAGRTGAARLRKYASVGGNLIKNVLRVLRTELSF
ncbi:MAG: HlyD family efflux transporter periplasmic adaptor subunit [Victivallales bacterium]